MEAIVLAGGRGTRLGSLTEQVPKPMLPVHGRPFLTYVLRHLASCGVQRVILSVGYLHKQILKAIGRNYEGMEIVYCVEDSPLGTGGAICQALSLCDDSGVAVLNGDTFFPLDLQAMQLFHHESSADLTLALKEMEDTSRYGRVRVRATDVLSFEEKKPGSAGFINAGVYFLPKNIFMGHPLAKQFSFERDFLEPFASKLRIKAFLSDVYFIDMGIPEDYVRAERELG